MPENKVKNKKLDLLPGLDEKNLHINEPMNIPDLKSKNLLQKNNKDNA